MRAPYLVFGRLITVAAPFQAGLCFQPLSKCQERLPRSWLLALEHVPGLSLNMQVTSANGAKIHSAKSGTKIELELELCGCWDKTGTVSRD